MSRRIYSLTHFFNKYIMCGRNTMCYPRIKVNLSKLENNVRKLVDLASENHIDIAGVTKVFSGHPEIAQAYVDGGVRYLADSRVENLKRLKTYPLEKILLRLPMISEAGKVVEYANISLNSEIKTMEKLSQEAIKRDKKHGIILMVDLGDLREGYFYEEEILLAVDKVKSLKGLKLRGLGTNLTCYGGIIPDHENISRLLDIKDKIENDQEVKLDIISAGNSSHLHFLLDGRNIEGVNNLRLGESLVLGGETAYGKRIESTYDDVFQLEVEIIEVKEKPSRPIGTIGKNAFGKTPSFVDKGVRKRLIGAIGQQDVDKDDIIALDEGLEILGASSDHLLLDGTDSSIDYKLGDKLVFNLSYGGILSTMTSEYVEKYIMDEK